MSANEQQQPAQRPQLAHPASQGMDPVQTLLLVLVIVIVLAGTGYVCVVHPSLTAQIGAVATVGAALAATFALIRRR